MLKRVSSILLIILAMILLCSCSSSPKKLEGITILMPLSTNYYDSEFKNLSNQLKDKGATIVVASNEEGSVKGEEGTSTEVHKLFNDINPDDYDAVVVIGGWHYPYLNTSTELKDFVIELNKDNKVIAGICNGTRFLATTGILEGKSITCRLDESIISEFENSGAEVTTKYRAMTDGNLVTAQGYLEDWDPFVTEIVKAITSTKEE